jgi:DNA-binding winged helix-turn-helix (wHTH) protein/TolB-like protein/tetratricopeptide (TPR) repeat protein
MAERSAGVYIHGVRARFGLFEFDDRTHELRRDGVAVKLPPQPARVLARLLARPGEVVLRDDLRAHLWGDDTFVDFERGLNFCIQQVRAALGDSADSPRFVQTVPRKGYRFIAPVAILSADSSPGARVIPDAAAPPEDAFPLARVEPLPVPPPPAQHVRVAARWLLAAAGVTLLIAPVVWLAGAGQRDGAGAAIDGRLRVAVLPFVNLTGRGDADLVADSMTDQLISELGRASPDRVAVIARTSAMSYRRTSKPLETIGRELNVEYVIEGSIHADTEGLQVTSTLVPVHVQTSIGSWSDAYTGAGSIPIRHARSVAMRLLQQTPAQEPPPRTANREGWEWYQKGRQYLYEGSTASLQQAALAFERAAALDPSFAGAWAQLAETQHALVMGGVARPLDAYPVAARAADRALALDGSLADAHLAKGLVQLWFEWRPAVASASFARALQLNGSHAAAHHDYAWASLALGRDAEAIAHITAARDLDPLSARATTDVGWLFLQLRRPAEAIRACRRTLAIHPDSLEAQACLDRAAAARTGVDTRMRREAARRVGLLADAARNRWISPYAIAVQETLAGNQPGAMAQLDAAYLERVGMLVLLRRDPAVDALRGSPRFTALLQRIDGNAE